jgi:hypothetical protein
MSDNNITINTNQSPYFDDFDKTKNYHQVLYKPALPVQARELSTQQSITRDQIKRFGDHVFANGSRVSGGELFIDTEYHYVKLKANHNLIAIDPSLLAGKTIIGHQSGATARVVNYSPANATTGDPDTLWIKYISGGSVTPNVQSIHVTNNGTGYTSVPTVTITGGGGTGAEAVAVLSSTQTVIGINVTHKGAGYSGVVTAIISGGSGSDAQAIVNLNSSAEFLGGERISDVGFTYSVSVASDTPTGTGCSVSNDEGYYYFNGNFIRANKSTLILDNYTNTPSYKIGFQITELVVNSGTDTTLLDNATGSYNYAGPGADRLKYTLTLAKKDLTSTDDEDFIEITRLVNGVKHADNPFPIYSVLEETFARRTFDESGNYTVRHFPIQLKPHGSDASKFIVRLDPGKAYVHGHEHETFVSTDITVDRARDSVSVNGFDRLMQYGNYTIVSSLSGLYDVTSHVTVDLHNVVSGSIISVDSGTYANTKIGTARVRQLTQTDYAGPFKMYLYDITMSAGDFGDVESIIIPESPLSGVIFFDAKCDIDNSGKVGGTAGGDTKLFETDFNTMVFKLPQDTIKTIRDDLGTIDTSFTIQRSFKNISISAGTCVLTSSGSNEKFYGTGLASGTVVNQYYHAIDNTTKAVKNLNTTSPAQATVTVATNGQSVTIFTGDSTQNATYDFIITMNVDTKQERVKSLVKNSIKILATPSGTALTYTSLTKADINSINAIYDSGDLNTAAVPPILTVSNASGTFIAGETITGGTSEATGTVIDHSVATEIKFVVTSGTFEGTETITGQNNGGVIHTATMVSLAAGDTVATANWTLDNGQRDNFYDHGRLQLTGTAATGQLLVVMDYFTHSGSGYLSVDSYSASTGYDDVPTFISPTTGSRVELRDCIDFRPRRADGATTLEGIELPYPNSNWQADYSFYQPRIDTIYLSREKSFGVHQGVAADLPVPPFRLDNTMSLYQLSVPAYTFKPTDVTATFIENKRYTMRDIGKLEKRINNVEYYTALSLLEKEADALVIKDTAGLDRFKNGILVDDFAGHRIGDVRNADYKCSIDFIDRELRPPFKSNIADLSFISGSSTGVQQTGDLITLPFTTTEFVTQTQASTFINVNPFNVTAWVGTLDLSPPSDNWVSTTNRPEVIVNATGENDAWEQLAGLGFGSQWNDWQDLGAGRNQRVVSRGQASWRGRRLVQRQTFAVDQTQTRQGIRTEIVGSDTVLASLGDRVVNVSVLPFIRAKDITVSVTGMKPNTRVYPFFDKTAVTTYCTPSGGSLGGAIYTDDSGSVTGLVFSIPCPVKALEQDPQLLVFRTGERQFLLTDDPNGNLETASTYADRMYQAQGMLQTKENVILSSRIPRLHVGAMGSASDLRTETRITGSRDVTIGWNDPLAQTFLIDANLYPDGIYLSSADLYFKSKDDGNVPVAIHIRDVEQGLPTNRVVPFSDVSLNPASVNVSDTAETATNFAFSDPCYLMPGEYAIVVMTNSLKYETWIAEMGQNIVGTSRKVSEQPYAGVFFKSQNASTWEQNQNQDLTFKLNRCAFTVTTGAAANAHEAVFHNSNSSEYKMDTMHLTPSEIVVNKTSVNWAIRTTDGSTSILSTTYTNTVANENHIFDNQQKITTTAGSFIGRARLTSTSEFITPYIDTARLSVIPIENIINNSLTGEGDASSGGSALAKYITRRVTLTDGFDATDLKAYLTMNKPAGVTVSVYYKVLSQYDPDTYDEKDWILMSQTSQSNTYALTSDEFIDYEFDPSTANVNYTSNGATYTTFKTFTIKVVMTSISTTKVPRIKDMRVIALA